MPSKENHYKNLAISYKGEVRMKRNLACILVEDKVDEHFWKNILEQKAEVEGKILYKSEVRSVEGNLTSGIGQIFQFMKADLLDKYLWAAVDSEYHYIKGEEKYKIEKFIFQTYTHSIENHFLYTENLDQDLFGKHIEKVKQVCENVLGVSSFGAFLEEYSKIVYPTFTDFLATPTSYEKLFKEIEFDYTDEEKNSLEKLKNKLKSQTPVPENAKNTYLYLRGHNIWDMSVDILKILQENFIHQLPPRERDMEKFKDKLRKRKPKPYAHAVEIARDLGYFYNAIQA